MVPARAGVILDGMPGEYKKRRGTRASGGDPVLFTHTADMMAWYPRERG